MEKNDTRRELTSEPQRLIPEKTFENLKEEKIDTRIFINGSDPMSFLLQKYFAFYLLLLQIKKKNIIDFPLNRTVIKINQNYPSNLRL